MPSSKAFTRLSPCFLVVLSVIAACLTAACLPSVARADDRPPISIASFEASSPNVRAGDSFGVSAQLSRGLYPDETVTIFREGTQAGSCGGLWWPLTSCDSGGSQAPWPMNTSGGQIEFFRSAFRSRRI